MPAKLESEKDATSTENILNTLDTVHGKQHNEDDAEVDSESVNETRAKDDTVKSKKKKKKSGSKNKSKTAIFQRWCADVLEHTNFDLLNKTPEQLLSAPAEFFGYSFTGSLRPAYVTKQVTVPDNILKPDYAETGFPESEYNFKKSSYSGIPIYSPEEISAIREVSIIGREVLDIASKFLKVGVTGDEIDRIVHSAIIERGAYPSPLNYNNFPKSLCVSVNEVICHGIPDCRVIQSGDIVNLDVSVYKNGVHTDLNETFLVGDCDEESKHLVNVAYTCLQLACEMIKPGTFYRDVGAVISKHATSNNCAVVKTYCGHGVGKLFHTTPNIPHYAKNKAVGIMKEGHIFTIEPMINLGNSHHDRTWPDNWTSVTVNGNRSAQFEHTFLVTETGCEILTARKGTSKSKMTWDESAVTR